VVEGSAIVNHSVLDSNNPSLIDTRYTVINEMSVSGDNFSSVLNWAARFAQPLIRSGESDSSVVLHVEYDTGASCSVIKFDKTYKSSELISAG